MKISEIITDKYKLRIPPAVYYALLADVQEVEDEQEPKTGHWNNIPKYKDIAWQCSECKHFTTMKHNYCPNCGCRIVEPQESEDTETWNGIHAQITAPKGTFERIFNDADDDNDI